MTRSVQTSWLLRVPTSARLKGRRQRSGGYRPCQTPLTLLSVLSSIENRRPLAGTVPCPRWVNPTSRRRAPNRAERMINTMSTVRQLGSIRKIALLNWNLHAEECRSEWPELRPGRPPPAPVSPGRERDKTWRGQATLSLPRRLGAKLQTGL